MKSMATFDRRLWRVMAGMAAVLAVLPALAGCAGKPAATETVITTTPAAVRILKGVSLSPRSISAEDFKGFFGVAAQAGNTVTWAGDWNELGKDTGGPQIITELAADSGYVPLVEVTVHSNGTLLRPLNDENRLMYEQLAVFFAQKYRPAYLGLGIEINSLYEKSPADFDTFVTLFNETREAIKARSPGTQVFTVFQLEKMKGYTLWSASPADPARAEWQLLDRFETDLAAFTTYPGLVFKDPADIPDDYYSEILTRTSKPVAFTEIGWHSEASPAGWESSEAEQQAFVERFFELTDGMSPRITIWTFLYDQPVIEPFRSMGLYRADGTPKPAWSAWTGAGGPG